MVYLTQEILVYKMLCGKFIMFVDSDDLLAKNIFDYLSKIIENEEFDLYQFSSIRFVNDIPSHEECCIDDIKIRRINSKKAMQNLILGGKNNTNEITPSPWGKLFKKEILEKYNIRFNEQFKMFEDGIFNIEYLERSEDVYISNYIVYLYRNDVLTSLTKSMDRNIMNQKILQIEYIKNIVSRNEFSEDIINVFIFKCIRSIFTFYVYHPDNKINYKERKKEIKSIFEVDYFKNVINNRKIYKYLEYNNKLICFLLKYKLYLSLNMVYKIIFLRNKYVKGSIK